MIYGIPVYLFAFLLGAGMFVSTYALAWAIDISINAFVKRGSMKWTPRRIPKPRRKTPTKSNRA